jgi:hypothetical protein
MRSAGLPQAYVNQPRVQDFADRVRGAVQQKLTGRRPMIDDIVEALHLSSRTLQRRFSGAGSSFQRVLEDSEVLEKHYPGSIAFLYFRGPEALGDTWEGVPPARWRGEQRAKAGS